ncbi:MAG: hypothetical protein WC783_04620 [Candidatus Paceibacterota bacterium]|jgi:hypothetical protein
MQFRNFSEAHRHAKDNKRKAEPGAEREGGQFASVDPKIFKYFFDHQSKIEKEGERVGSGMDYHLYARNLWEDLIGEIDQENEELFQQFKNTMIVGLHEIDMRPMVYGHVQENLAQLVRQYIGLIRHIALWSTGDVEATGYQVGKISSSQIIKDFHKALKAELPNGQAGDFMREKTSYFVADNKFASLSNYVVGEIDKNPNKDLKIVIIEDSKKNFDKVKETLARNLGEYASRVQVIPIWVTYSREGTQDEEKAVTPEEKDKLAETKSTLNAIHSFAELLDEPRFGSVLQDAHVFVDFDGVIGNNIAMREEQARVIYGALMNAGIKATGLSEKELVEKIKDNIT